MNSAPTLFHGTYIDGIISLSTTIICCQKPHRYFHGSETRLKSSESRYGPDKFWRCLYLWYNYIDEILKGQIQYRFKVIKITIFIGNRWNTTNKVILRTVKMYHSLQIGLQFLRKYGLNMDYLVWNLNLNILLLLYDFQYGSLIFKNQILQFYLI